MYPHGYNWRKEPRGIAFSSVLLLLIHVCAAAFIVGMAMMRPWADDPVPAAGVEEYGPPVPAATDAQAVVDQGQVPPGP